MHDSPTLNDEIIFLKMTNLAQLFLLFFNRSLIVFLCSYRTSPDFLCQMALRVTLRQLLSRTCLIQCGYSIGAAEALIWLLMG